MKTVPILVVIVAALIGSDAQRCGRFQSVQEGQNVTVTSPGFPGRYSPGTDCDWTFAANGTGRLAVECDVIDLPESPERCVDWLVYGTGEGVPNGTICGTRGLKYQSTSQRLSLALVSDPSGKAGGKLTCRVTLKPAAPTGRGISTSGCDCGKSPYMTRIVGGTETKVNEFPFMAGLISSEEGGLICGATIVSRNYVVTAAHCVARRSPATLAVLVGDWDTSTGSDTTATQLIKASAVIANQGYDSRTEVNDIALVRTAQPMAFGDLVNAACLPWKLTQGTDLVGYNVLAIGWGTVEFGGPRSTRLKKVTLTSIDKIYCQLTYPDKFSYFTQLCTFSPGGDACQFDSGGPIVYLDPMTNRYFLVGIISYGRGCAGGYPSVNTKVYPYLNWIYGYTSSESYCSR